MYKRFTQAARTAVGLARDEASRLRQDVGPEHLLLGILLEGHDVGGLVLAEAGVTYDDIAPRVRRDAFEGIDADALASIGIDLAEVRRRAEELFGADAVGASSERGGPRFSEAAKKALELALRETLQMGGHEIGTGHLLLGLLRQGGRAYEILCEIRDERAQDEERSGPGAREIPHDPVNIRAAVCRRLRGPRSA